MKSRPQIRWKSIQILLFCFAMAGFNGCGEPFSGFNGENVRNNEDSSVLYAMRGNQIITSYSEWPIPEGEEPSEVTSRYDFLMIIDFKSGDDKQVRFYGLEGADVGKRDQFLFADCDSFVDCEVTAVLDGDELTINLEHNGRSYKAEGAIRNITDSYYTNDSVEMTATYKYQQTTIQYELRGGVVIE